MSRETIWDQHSNRIGYKETTYDKNGRPTVCYYDKDGKLIRKQSVQTDYKGREYISETEFVHETPPEKPASGDDNIFMVLFAMLIAILRPICKVILWILEAAYLYFLFPIYTSITIWVFVSLLLFAVMGLLPVCIGLALVGWGLYMVSLPYWFTLFSQKKKKSLTWKQILPYFKKWFFKGPLAYRDLKVLKENAPTAEE